MLIFYAANIADQFYQEFSSRYTEAGGRGDVMVDVKNDGKVSKSF